MNSSHDDLKAERRQIDFRIFDLATRKGKHLRNVVSHNVVQKQLGVC